MNVNGKELAVEIDGPEDAPVVLLVHGLGGTSNFYQVQTDALAERRRVIRVDFAGAGRSPLTDDISITGHADDLAAVLDALNVDAAAVVGHSMGTLVVRELAARHPEKVSALVLLGAVREPAEAGRQAQRDRAAVLREKGTAAVAPGVVAGALSETTRRDPSRPPRPCSATSRSSTPPGPTRIRVTSWSRTTASPRSARSTPPRRRTPA